MKLRALRKRTHQKWRPSGRELMRMLSRAVRRRQAQIAANVNARRSWVYAVLTQPIQES